MEETHRPDDDTNTDQVTKQIVASNKKRHILIISAIVIILVLLIGGVIVTMFLSKKSVVTPPTTNTVSNKKTNTEGDAAIINVWKGAVNPAAIPLGDGNVSQEPKIGYTYSCTTRFRGGGARHAGDWINTADNTWNSQTKVAVLGSVAWPNASYSDSHDADGHTITTNDLPVGVTTGNYPISRKDPAYQYDTNPNAIAAQNFSYRLSLEPSAATEPNCVPLGVIGVLNNGVALFNSLDDAGRDAVAHETQDSCDGHPDGKEAYHYHDVSRCILEKATGSSTLVGYALDGFGIYVERDESGNLPTNADLDECHGRTSKVEWNGRLTSIYHYSATIEYPYVVGCFHGSPVIK